MDETSPQRPGPVPEKVLLLQTAFIGDVIFISPLVHAIKQAYPQARLTLMVRPAKAEVAACIPGVDDVATFDKRGREAGLFGLLRAARKIRRQGFDLLIAPHRSTRSALLAHFSRIPLRVGYRCGLGRLCYHLALRPDGDELCRLVQDQQLLRRVGIDPAGHKLRLKAPPQHRQLVTEFLRANGLPGETRLVALCIGSVWPTKRWPPVYFASLAESLFERGYRPVLFGGGDEIEIADEIERVVPGKVLSCVGNSLTETAALIDRCEMAVGSDSGLTHMARALGVPSVLIYGPTDSHQHRFEERCQVLAAKVPCRPCSRHGHNRCPERHHDCMRLVSPEQVMDALRQIAGVQTPVPADGGQARVAGDRARRPRRDAIEL